MKFFIYLFVGAMLVGVASAAWTVNLANNSQYFTDFEAGFEEIDQDQPSNISLEPKLQLIKDWQRPEGSLKVALQVGHWQNEEVPEELEGLKKNAGGARGGGKYEWEVMLNIANLLAEELRQHNLEVDILPTTIPPAYYADAFIALHADGNTDTTVTGFKVASPRWDYSGKSKTLEALLYEEYEQATGLSRDPNVTRRMRGYYAFNWRRYSHAIHPMTPAAILETGFLTSPADRKILINNPQPAVAGIVQAVLSFLELEA
jgi:N-acetylmuramoyl-L-alanine amidase